MKHIHLFLAIFLAAIAVSCGSPTTAELNPGTSVKVKCPSDNFRLTCQVMTDNTSAADLLFASNGTSGYQVRFHGGAIDGTTKTGSLTAIRNRYRSIVPDNEWFSFELAVRGKNISVKLNGTEVVCYTEPEKPYRINEYADMVLDRGDCYFIGDAGKVSVKDIKITSLPEGEKNPSDTLPPVDEQNDKVIRLQQEGFPVIDYHVHLKGGLTKEIAWGRSLNYGINYGVAPNAGEGGDGRMYATDEELYEYIDDVKDSPFLYGVQGEGRKWITTVKPETLNAFEYLFTDAMTIVDKKGNISRLYHPEEVKMYGMSEEQYMDYIVDQTVKILTYEPADFYANPTYIPESMQKDYDKLWTPERVDKVLDVLAKYNMALEINSRYRIPSFSIIKRAKERGIKFTFGTNNMGVDNLGRLEYCFEAIDSCGLTPDDIWFPSMSTRSSRKAVNYNNF
jgi:hypothetical protein